MTHKEENLENSENSEIPEYPEYCVIHEMDETGDEHPWVCKTENLCKILEESSWRVNPRRLLIPAKGCAIEWPYPGWPVTAFAEVLKERGLKGESIPRGKIIVDSEGYNHTAGTSLSEVLDDMGEFPSRSGIRAAAMFLEDIDDAKDQLTLTILPKNLSGCYICGAPVTGKGISAKPVTDEGNCCYQCARDRKVDAFEEHSWNNASNT